MRYLIAIFCPPLAILLCGRLLLALVSGILWFICFPLIFAGIGTIGWLLLVMHAWMVIADHKAERRPRLN